MPLYIHRSGNWVETDDLFVVYKGAWREVMAVYAYTTNPETAKLEWLPAFDRFQQPPVSVKGTNPTHVGGTLVWTAPPRATEYRVVMRTKATSTQPARTDYFPANPNDPWITSTSWTLTGLQHDRIYDLTVIARRPSPSDDSYAVSTESAKATLTTGHPATVVQNPEYPGTQTVYVTAARTDTWSKDRSWGQTGGDVVQGYASVAARNGHGAVSYSTAYTQLTKLPGGAMTADHIEVIDAVIDRVYRKVGGSGKPTVEAHAWRGPFSGDPRETDFPASEGTFTAPAEGDFKDEFDILGPVDVTPRESKILTWAKQWVKRSPSHIGMLIYRGGGTGNATAGYNGYAILRVANWTSREWRLKLSVRWTYHSPELLAAKWTPGA